MRRAPRIPLLIVCVAVAAAGSAGCAAGLLHRGGPAVTTVRTAAPDARAQAKQKAKADRAARKAAARAEKQAARGAARPNATPADATAARDRKDSPRAAKRAERADDRAAAAATAKGDPLGDARARAQQNPTEPYWPYRVAQLQSSAGLGGQAEDALRTSIARDSGYTPALTTLSRLLYQQGRHDEAVRLLSPVRAHRVSMPPADRAAVLSGLALHESALGRDDEARATLEELARDERDDAAGASAWLAVRGTENTAALALTERALKLDPRSAANHNNRGIALLRAADPDGAAREFERAIELDPARPGPYYNLAILERWYRLDHVAAARRFQQYWTRSHADPDSLYAELGRAGTPTPVAEEGSNR